MQTGYTSQMSRLFHVSIFFCSKLMSFSGHVPLTSLCHKCDIHFYFVIKYRVVPCQLNYKPLYIKSRVVFMYVRTSNYM